MSGFGTPADRVDIDPGAAKAAAEIQAALDDGRAAAAAGLDGASHEDAAPVRLAIEGMDGTA